jgi:hypothetical protein
MWSDQLPPKGERIKVVVTGGGDAPVDPVGTSVGEFLTELLDGIVVELIYTPSGVEPDQVANELAQAATAHRDGPGSWSTTMIVNVAGAAGDLLGTSELAPQLPSVIASLPAAAFRAADSIGRQSGLDGNVITPPIQRALQDSVVIELLCGQLEQLSNGHVAALDARGVVTETVAEIERVAASRIEGRNVSLGVVMRPSPGAAESGHSFPGDFQMKRVPLLFDGQTAALVIDANGRVEREVQRSRLERSLTDTQMAAVEEFVDQFGDLDGSLVASLSKAFNGLGFYARPDHSIWICSQGPPLIVKRTGRWKAIPTEALAAGVARIIGSMPTAELLVETAVLLSLHGHGGILAVAASAGGVDGLVQSKDRVDDVVPGTAESAVHGVLDVEDLDTATLVRLASIDGACVLDRSGQLVAYGAVVTSSDSTGEGARTAAARFLSERLDVVIKVSEDGPISVFRDGEEIARLLD